MKSFLTFFLLVLALNGNAQILELGYGPVSVTGWGNLPRTQKIDFSVLFEATQFRSFHYIPGLRYTFVNSTSTGTVDEFDDPVEGRFNMIFLLPAAFNITFNRLAILNRMGFGWSDKPFPNHNGLHANFILEAGLRYAILHNLSLSLRYSHISNGFRGLTNPGVDNIILSAEVQL